MQQITGLFTAARLAAAVTILGGLAAFITGIAGVFPHGWQNAALAGAGLLTKAVTALKFLEGNQRFEASPAGQEQATGPVDDEPADVPDPIEV